MAQAGAGRVRADAATTPPSAADLVAYQAAVDAATAEVAVADQAVAQATIVSPIAGTVIAVGLQAGASVTVSSTTERVVVQGPGGYEATTLVSVDDIPHVATGQAATVRPDGPHQPVTGTVVSVSPVPDAQSTTTSFRVTVGLVGDTSSLDDGGLGDVSIVTGTADAALSVPTSAVATVAGRHVVTVVVGATTSVVPVQVGVVGRTWTQITGGLDAGQQVVLADLRAPLPSSATQANPAATRTGTGTGGGGFGGFGGGGRLGTGGGTGAARRTGG